MRLLVTNHHMWLTLENWHYGWTLRFFLTWMVKRVGCLLCRLIASICILKRLNHPIIRVGRKHVQNEENNGISHNQLKKIKRNIQNIWQIVRYLKKEKIIIPPLTSETNDQIAISNKEEAKNYSHPCWKKSFLRTQSKTLSSTNLEKRNLKNKTKT